MKLRIRNNGNGWYEYVTNYKDKEDKCYNNIHFTKECIEPQITGDYCDIEIIEGWHTCYKGKIGTCIKQYRMIENSQEFTGLKSKSDEDRRYEEAKGAEQITLNPDDLPFY